MRRNGSWSTRTRKREKIGTGRPIEGSQFTSLNPTFSLESDPISKEEEYEKSSAVSKGDTYSDRAVEEDDYAST